MDEEAGRPDIFCHHLVNTKQSQIYAVKIIKGEMLAPFNTFVPVNQTDPILRLKFWITPTHAIWANK